MMLPRFRSGKRNLGILLQWMGRPTSCNFCGEPCESLVLYCLECQFAIHLLCGPLPRSIYFRYCHRERLTLTPSLEGDEDDSDDEGFYAYCDECEEEVERGSRAYICRECGALAHLTCVIDQVCALNLTGSPLILCPWGRGKVSICSNSQ